MIFDAWREEWTAGEFRPLRAAYAAGLAAFEDLKAEAERVAADPDLTGEGKAFALRQYSEGRPVLALETLREALAGAEAAIAGRRAALVLPASRDAIEEMRRAELRAALRTADAGMVAGRLGAAGLASGDPELLLAVATAHPLASGVSRETHERLRDAAIRQRFPDELAAIAELEAATAVVSGVERELAKEVTARSAPPERRVPRMTMESANA